VVGASFDPAVLPVLRELGACAARLGLDPTLVQAAGGNTSLKHGGVLYVKASGIWMSDAANREIHVPLHLAALRTELASN
jgi:rhamnose utilization protein RhaD (predicted bifunctional aldolase and dehydrogenase)